MALDVQENRLVTQQLYVTVAGGAAAGVGGAVPAGKRRFLVSLRISAREPAGVVDISLEEGGAVTLKRLVLPGAGVENNTEDEGDEIETPVLFWEATETITVRNNTGGTTMDASLVVYDEP